jgi:hypothetical protein
MPTKIRYGNYNKISFVELGQKAEKKSRDRIEGGSVSNSKTRNLEKYVQEYFTEDAAGNTTGGGSAVTARLVYNVGCAVTRDLLDSLSPNTAGWRDQRNTVAEQIDAAFPPLTPLLQNFTFGKGMRRWFDRAEGFGPCLAFNAECKPDTNFYRAVQDKLLKTSLSADGADFRLVNQGVGYYRGPKGKDRAERRDSIDVFEFCDPLNEDVYRTFTSELNLDFKFALAKPNGDGVSADLPVRYFYHGEHPLVSISYNFHVKLAQENQVGLNDWNQVEIELLKNIDPFKRFIMRSLDRGSITTPHLSTKFKGWIGSDKQPKSRLPTHLRFQTEVVNDDPNCPVRRMGDLDPLTMTNALSSEASSDSEEEIVVRPSTNRYANFAQSDSDEESYSSASSVDSEASQSSSLSSSSSA